MELIISIRDDDWQWSIRTRGVFLFSLHVSIFKYLGPIYHKLFKIFQLRCHIAEWEIRDYLSFSFVVYHDPLQKIMALHNTMGCVTNGYRFASKHSFTFSRNKNIYILNQISLIVSLTVQLTIIHHWRTTHLWTTGQIQRHKVIMCKMSSTCSLINLYFLYHIYNVVPYNKTYCDQHVVSFQQSNDT